ncbi:MAG: signal peptidase I [Candidatus Helarchaeota archaeon]
MTAKNRLKHFFKNSLVKKFLVLILIIGTIFGTVGGFFFGSMITLQTEMPYTVVISTSMVPTLNVGDFIVVQGIPEDQVQVGDIIIFYTDFWGGSKPGYPVIHRVIEIYEDNDIVPIINQPANNNSYYNGKWFKTKGDNNDAADTYPTPYFYSGRRQVIGRMILNIPFIGWPQVLLTSFGGQYVVIFIIGLLILLLIYFTISDNKPDKKEKKDESTEK